MSYTSDIPNQDLPSRTRVRIGVIIALIGFVTLVVGTHPEWFGWGSGSGIGFVQLFGMLLGLGILSLGGFVALLALWRNTLRTIVADIGMRLVATGYVVAIFAGLADLFGMGTEIGSAVMHFGLLQSRGIVIGQAVIGVGFVLMIPFGANPPSA